MEKKKGKGEKYGLESHMARFGTEEQCRQFLVNKKWDGRPTCHHCKNKHMNYFITTRNIWKCSSCKKQFSVRKGTIFEDSNLPLTTWFKALYFFTAHKRGLSSCQVAKLLEVEQRTAWFLLHRLREVIKESNDNILTGIVEVDETYIAPKISRDTRLQRAKKKHDEEQEKIHGMTKQKKRRLRGEPAQVGRKKGETKEVLEKRKAEKTKLGDRIPFEKPKVVLGMTERGGNVALIALGLTSKVVTKENVYPLMRKHITSDSILYTDQYNLYDDIGQEFSEHESVHHKKKEFVRGDVHVNSIENVWNHFQKAIDGTWFWLSIGHFQKYLNEHAFRWNIRNISEKAKIDAFLDNLLGKRLKYQELIIPKNAA